MRSTSLSLPHVSCEKVPGSTHSFSSWIPCRPEHSLQASCQLTGNLLGLTSSLDEISLTLVQVEI